MRLDLAYDGTAFSGWARQRDRRSVQGVLEDALAVLVRGPVGDAAPRLTVAGRTDAGVHARGQVAHVDLPPATADDPLLLRRLNGLLPDDVHVHGVRRAPAGFDARFSALARTYRYRVADGPEAVDPLRRTDTLAWPRRLDLAAMRAACPGLLGEHDFAAYCRRRPDATTVRALLALDWERDGDGVLVLTVKADAFCHSMVRSLVGALLAVGEGRRAPQWPAALLSSTTRSSEVAVAPPHGLTLVQVDYPPDEGLMARQEVTRAMRERSVVRAVGPDDWSAWRALRLQALQDAPIAYCERYDDAVALPEAAWRGRLGAAGVHLLAGPAQAPLGMAAVHLDAQGRAGLENVFVRPDARGGGVLEALVAAAVEWARERDHDELRLLVHESNSRAQAAYRRLGFLLTGETSPYPLDPTTDELVMVRRVRGEPGRQG